MNARKSFSRKDRVSIFTLRNGKCYLCNGEIIGSDWDIEHRVPVAMGGDNEPDNLELAHRKCHASKTKTDVGNIAQAKRREAKHKGFIRPKQSIQSAGFSKTIKPQKLTKSPLPPRALYKDTSQ